MFFEKYIVTKVAIYNEMLGIKYLGYGYLRVRSE